MNWTHTRNEKKRNTGGTERTATIAAREAVAKAKQRLHEEFQARVGENLHLLRLALNEAEALAWQTEFPHLFFPALAIEKANAAVAWHRRQRKVRGAAMEWAFAE
jgi:hypothetical protein